MASIAQLKAQGLLFAPTRDGHALPVIDLTHPRFFVPDDPAAIAGLRERMVREEGKMRRLPRFLLRWIMRRAAKQSKLMQALFHPGTDFLDGLSTYVMKLGAENLVPPFDNPADRRFAAAPHLVLLRLRMQQVARLLADGLVRDLPERPAAPLHFINVAGGPAMDSVNTLIGFSSTMPIFCGVRSGFTYWTATMRARGSALGRSRRSKHRARHWPDWISS